MMTRITRTTKAGTAYVFSADQPPSRKTRDALDQLADATRGRRDGDGLAAQDARHFARSRTRDLIARHKATNDAPLITPATLMAELRLTRSQACTALEELEAAGELVRAHGAPAMVFKPAPPAQKIGRAGYHLQLTPREHGALLRGLERLLLPTDSKPDAHVQGDVTLLREIRRRLKGGPL